MTAKIVDIVYHLPDTILTNETLAAEFEGVTPREIFKLSGVKQRHIAFLDETPSDMAVVAANKLFNKHPDKRAQIDALLFITEGLDYKAPVTACLIHQQLGLPTPCLSLDIPGGCAGFINGLQIAKSLVAGNPKINNVLLLTAEVVSKVLHDNDLNLRSLFGDGATATLVSRSEQSRIGNFVSGTDGKGAKSLWVEHSGFRAPASLEWLEENKDTTYGMKFGRLRMKGDEIMHFSLSRVPSLIKETLTLNNMTSTNYYLFHQASQIILKSLQRKCRIPQEQFIYHLADTGNTVSSTIPIALSHMITTQKIKTGDSILLAGFGIGLSWGATVIYF